MNAVEIKNLTTVLNGIEVIKNINLTLEQGKFLGIVGPNGCGKTTLLRTIIGSATPLSGSVTVFGMTPKEAVKAHIFGYLPQNQNIINNFPARSMDVVLMGLYGQLGLFRWPTKKHKQKAYEMLDILGMSGLGNATFSKLSGGQKQRISIARALINNPKLLILDEPSTGIDMVGQTDFYQLLKELQNQIGLSIIMVSHDIGAITTFVDEIACINKTLYYHGNPFGALDRQVLEKLYGRKVSLVTHSDCCSQCDKNKHE
ncbi:MAG: metal ABC transporter ATP-binding protein [Nitrospirae bacterium]|nr:metal ABC transporter ATP-binding protein [Nitrospirota bacterium]